MYQGKICDKCNLPTMRLIPQSKPSSGEDYCMKCHLSYQIHPDEIHFIEKQMRSDEGQIKK
jgi:hypothetical protein